ncbi:MAG: glycosyltransferase family 39 protein [Thermoguttaceae bacterium]|nr:glycosyltransferase family 39 protein [Thermoguttaceae bacterium]
MSRSDTPHRAPYDAAFFLKTVIPFALVWTFAPLLFLPNYWLDIIEQLFVGKEFVLSTGKHPALTAIILYLFRTMLGNASFAPFLLSQLMMGTVLWTVWRLGRLFLDPPRAAAALLVSLNYYWMNFGSADYNNNITLIFGWGLSFYFGLEALRTNRWRDWIGLGLAVGIGLHLKYTEIFFPVSLILFLAWNKERRRFLRSGRFWLAAAIGFLIFLPQTLWILKGNIRAIQYALTLEGDENPMIFHLLCPLIFAFIQLTFWVLPVVFLLPLFWGSVWEKRPVRPQSAAGGLSGALSAGSAAPPVGRFGTERDAVSQKGALSIEESYLLAMTFLPFLMQVVYAAISAHFVRLSLGCHLWVYVPIILLRFFPSRKDDSAVRKTISWNLIVAACVLLTSAAVALIYPLATEKCSRYLFPGKKLAARVEKEWHARYAVPIPWATGQWWLAGNLSVYGNDHPRVHYSRGPDLFCGEWQATTWGTYDDINRQGGVLLWEIRGGEPEEPPRLRELFPNAVRTDDFSLNGLLTAKGIEMRFGMAVVPPPDESPGGR